MPNLHDAYESFGDAGLEILSISFDRKPEDITSFRYRRWPMPWHHAYAEDGFGGDLAKSFGVKGIPKPILVGPDGIVVSADFLLRGPDLQRTLRKVLAP
jgi:hypothetical protein